MLPEQEEGEEAAAGTEAHTEIERVLGPYHDRPDTQLDADALIAALDREHPAAYGIAMLLKFVAGLPAGRMWIEQRVELTKHIWGRCDVAHYDAAAKVLTIVDYKNGMVDIQAEENEQLQIYAAASIFTHNLAVDHVRLVVVQPNSWVPGPRVKQWPMSAAALYDFATRAAAIPAGALVFKAGEHCRYCPLFSRCEPTRDLLAQLSIALQHTPDEVRPEQRAAFKMLAKPIEDWFKSADKVWGKDALSKGAPPGMKIVTSKTNREWIDEAAARAAIIAAKGVEALSPPTPAQAEDMGIDVSTLARKPPGGPVLALESDRRAPWVRPSAAEMFAGVTNAAPAK